jgi:Zn-dependent peptidase ImmA (M78 family)/DNA-binding XRE family transcriptional regulator
MTFTPLALMAVNTAAEVGARIRRAREQARLTQGELGEAIGKTQTAVSYWEAGRRSPDVDDLVAIADTLDVEVTYFFERAQPKPKRVLLRAQAALRPFDDLIADIEKFASSAEHLPPLRTEVHVRSHSPAKAAQQLLAQTRTTEAPVDIKKLCVRCGVHVIEAPFSNEVSGVILDLNNGPVIGVNQDHPLVRRRFSAAHELGHYLLAHHDHFHIDLSDAAGQGEPPGYNWLDERNANDFAAQVLMPAALVAAAFAANSNLNQVARQFKVSREAMGWRLVNLGLLA